MAWIRVEFEAGDDSDRRRAERIADELRNVHIDVPDFPDVQVTVEAVF